MSTFAEAVLFAGASTAFRANVRHSLKDDREGFFLMLDVVLDTLLSLGCMVYAGVLMFGFTFGMVR